MVENLGNVVALIKSENPPAKTFVVWAKILDISQPDIVQLHVYVGGSWVPLVAQSPILSVADAQSSSLDKQFRIFHEGSYYLLYGYVDSNQNP